MNSQELIAVALANKATKGMSGWSREEFLRNTVEGFFQCEDKQKRLEKAGEVILLAIQALHLSGIPAEEISINRLIIEAAERMKHE